MDINQRLRFLLLHKAMWDWLVENPNKSKGEWPGWINANLEVKKVFDRFSKCFLCAIYSISCMNLAGERCPVWKLDSISCVDKASVYASWDTSVCDKNKYAKIIRDCVNEEIERLEKLIK